ncbi:hypothetical protein F8388_004058 [Cannabis sativa]|uniref:Uncharacterized protein n=1 Tax=Cannabis sativa TaxID=3483 RepID=A0A7J6GPI1_CANSA|nr:hypothetical protein F8388_002433 [Cannabis sativa]KAF4354038.1 hypothetical protein F8388_002438 [Cannabis sativa]KAF4354040.1 hypothetical protein F8388_002440 [Cannabis sativa]KAF4384751.1 hypothetical protein F8388_004058 [Cannabis sativa]
MTLDIQTHGYRKDITIRVFLKGLSFLIQSMDWKVWFRERGDVYSYGITLMEIGDIHWKKATHEMFTREMNLKQRIENSIQHTIN